jgi:F-type H+-transporting ATPase subunit delta
MSNPNTPSQMASSIYHATVKELSAAHDPQLQHEVLKSLDEMLRGGDQNAAGITSAVALTADERNALESKLRAKFGRDLAFAYQVDPALLGGVIVKVGDKIIDGSLASKLNAMAETLLGGVR